MIKELPPAERELSRGRTTKGYFMATTKDSATAPPSTQPKDERRRKILHEAVHRYNHELMDDSERQLLMDRIRRLRRKLAA